MRRGQLHRDRALHRRIPDHATRFRGAPRLVGLIVNLLIIFQIVQREPCAVDGLFVVVHLFQLELRRGGIVLKVDEQRHTFRLGHRVRRGDLDLHPAVHPGKRTPRLRLKVLLILGQPAGAGFLDVVGSGRKPHRLRRRLFLTDGQAYRLHGGLVSLVLVDFEGDGNSLPLRDLHTLVEFLVDGQQTLRRVRNGQISRAVQLSVARSGGHFHGSAVVQHLHIARRRRHVVRAGLLHQLIPAGREAGHMQLAVLVRRQNRLLRTIVPDAAVTGRRCLRRRILHFRAVGKGLEEQLKLDVLNRIARQIGLEHVQYTRRRIRYLEGIGAFVLLRIGIAKFSFIIKLEVL